MKKYLIKSVVTFSLLLTGLSAKAYDVDTHFYGTYSLARFAGIKHEVALKIATGAQWMDESYISDPLSMIVLPDVGIKKRRLLHFPGTRIANAMTVNSLPTMLDPSSKVKLKSFTETEADHEFATEMLTEGLMKGDLMMASVGLHTLEDSFAHAGTIAELGHAHFWHHPDRPYVDDPSVQKYFRMCRSVLKAMVAIRMSLPANGVDMQFQYGSEPNYLLNGDELADMYENIPIVRQAVSKKILNEKEYVDFALKHVFKAASGARYINAGYEPYLANYTTGQDTYDASEKVVLSMPKSMINMQEVLKATGRPNLSSDYVLSMGGLGALLSRVITDLISDWVPRPLDSYHKFEKEHDDGPIWVHEIQLRVNNMRVMIKNLYGKDIAFVKNMTSSKDGFLKEVAKDKSAQSDLRRYNKHGVEIATYNLEEKYKFNHMIFGYLFPKLTKHLGDKKSEIDAMAQLVVTANADDESLLKRAYASASAFATATGQLLNPFSDMRTRFQLARQDITQSRLVPNPLNKYYTRESLVKKELRLGHFSILSSNEEIQTWINKQ